MVVKEFNPNILSEFFNLKVREACKSCKRYGKKATCPPYLDSIEYYQNLLPKYQKGILFIKQFEIDDINNWQSLGHLSSKVIHNKLLEERDSLLQQGKFPIIFGAGSCKYCSETCTFPCKYPEKSVIPIEATGLDVVGLTNFLTKIEITFPVKNTFYRVGMMLYDE